jgi:PIN domain nuclease of toxin-antitoxin system
MSRELLLDTCTLLWLAIDQTKLSRSALDSIAKSPDGLAVSAISAFEIGVKYSRRALELPLDPARWFPRVLRQHGVRSLSVTARIAVAATMLQKLHNDPFDRIIIATARLRDLAIVTPDALIRAYPDIECIW